MAGPVTIRDVARAAGVSPATVSRVLNASGHPVREATRHRVLEAVRRLEYYPNRLARGLLRRETAVVGLLVPDVSNPYYASILRGVEDVAHQHGLVVVLCNTDRDAAKQRHYLRTLLEHRVDGLVVAGGTLTAEELRMVDRRVPVVAVGRHPAPVVSVRVDNVEAARQACRHLLELGHTSIGLLAGPRSSLTARDRAQGYALALREAGVEPEGPWVSWSEFTAQGGYRAARDVLSADGLTALVASNDQMALGALRALWELGLRVPEDVSVVGFDDTPAAAVAVPALTTVAIPTYEMGRRTLELLLAIRQGRRARSVVLPTELRVRESTAAPEPARVLGACTPGARRYTEGREKACRHP
jgi:DNA-binding LacI/PurR family transcriptional regulator